MGLSTHVLDTTRGRPAAGIAVRLERLEAGRWAPCGSGTTNADGRIASLLAEGLQLARGTHRLTFATEPYFAQHGGGFYPEVAITFEITKPEEHHHVPLLLSPFGYSTYRGS